MTRGTASRHPGVIRLFRRFGLLALAAFLCLAPALVAFAQAAAAATDDTSDFGQYIVKHQDALAPFFSKNSGDFFRQAIPALLSVVGWVLFISMVVGWVLDVLMSRAYAFIYAPAKADWKRAIFYATGSLLLSFLCTGVMGLVLVLLLGSAQSQILAPFALLVLCLVAIVVQVGWVLYLFRTTLGISVIFYIVVAVVHVIASFLITQPILGSRASPDITNFVDKVMTPRLQAEAQATREQLASVTGGRDSSQAKVTQCQQEISQAEIDQADLSRQIEQKKNSDIYTFAQLIKARARGELETARDGLAAFPTKFPGSYLLAQARSQLAAVNAQMAAAEAQHKQQVADEVETEAAARIDLLARAAKGQATLTEMRHALIGKSRAEVKDLLGAPSGTASDQWNYSKQMIVNPLTGQVSGLTIYFNEGTVQSLDYNK